MSAPVLNAVPRARRIAAALALAVALLVVPAAAASAHIQVSPAAAAPNDPVRFTVLVPGEREQETRRVELRVPAGVLPFSFGDTPGWNRRIVPAADGSIERIVWTGHMAKDGFAEFSFLAGTPEHGGTIAWKALQVYSDGKVVRWIGAPGSESPAPTTRVAAGVPRQNAGGESGGAEGGTPAAPATAARATAPAADGPDRLARGAALAGLLMGLAALGVSMFRIHLLRQ